MIYYLDASAWVKYYIAEAGSSWIERFWETTPACASSVLAPVEVMAAVRRRLPQDLLRVNEICDQVCRQFEGIQPIPVTANLLQVSRTMLLRHGLRGADAVHLSSAVYLRDLIGQPITLIACDAELLSAAATEQFIVIDPTKEP